MSKGKKILLGVVITLIILGVTAYTVIRRALTTITVAIDNKSVKVDMSELITGTLAGSFNLIVTNPTVFPLPAFTLFLTASLPDGTNLGALSTPGRFKVAPSAYTAIPVTFNADAVNDLISGIVNLAQGGGHLNIIISGYILVWGIFKISIKSTEKVT